MGGKCERRCGDLRLRLISMKSGGCTQVKGTLIPGLSFPTQHHQPETMLLRSAPHPHTAGIATCRGTPHHCLPFPTPTSVGTFRGSTPPPPLPHTHKCGHMSGYHTTASPSPHLQVWSTVKFTRPSDSHGLRTQIVIHTPPHTCRYGHMSGYQTSSVAMTASLNSFAELTCRQNNK